MEVRVPEMEIIEDNPALDSPPQYPVNRRRHTSWTLTAFAVACTALLQVGGILFPWFVERGYTRRFYPLVASGIGSISGRVPFSIGETLILLIVTAAIFAIPLFMWKAVRLKGAKRHLIQAAIRRIALTLSIFLFLFTLVWGLNYRRPQLADTMGFEQSEPSPAELEQVALDVIRGINENYILAYGDGHRATSEVFGNQRELAGAINNAYKRARELPGTAGLEAYAPPKPLLFATTVARFGVSGIYSPFTAEPNYLGIMPGFDLPLTMAHEMAHARGFARENEAEFAGFVACVTSDDPRLRYSGYLGALRVLGPLYIADRERYRTVMDQLGQGPRNDLKTRSEFWARFTGRASAVGSMVNNVYLRANGIKTGIKNYDESSWLMIKYLLMDRSRNAADAVNSDKEVLKQKSYQ